MGKKGEGGMGRGGDGGLGVARKTNEQEALIFYHPKSTAIEIIRILHDRMDVETHLRIWQQPVKL